MLAKKRNRRKIKKELKESLINSLHQNGTVPCFYCPKKMNLPEITVDHFIPIKDGGLNTLENYRLCCYECNRAKGSLHPQSPLFEKFIQSRIKKN